MDTYRLDENRVYYEHGMSCSGSNFYPANERGLKTCKDCAGIFDKDGKGILVTSKKLDENYIPPENS